MAHSPDCNREGVGFTPRPIGVGFVGFRMAVGQVFRQVLRFSPSISFHQCSILILLSIAYAM
jgi:hypothetical protein